MEARCQEYDSIHGSRAFGGHTCTCERAQGHGSVHTCPTCDRRWGQPNPAPLRPTPSEHIGTRHRRQRQKRRELAAKLAQFLHGAS